MKKNPTFIAIGAILVCALTLGTYSALSVYMAPIAEKFNTDLGQVAFIFTMCGICGLIVSLFLGNIIKAIGIKKFIVIDGISVVIFFMTIAFSNSMSIVFFGAFLFGIINGGFGVCQTEISVWFAKGQGTLISFLSVGMGITAMILSPVLSKLLISYDISKICIIHGLVVGIIVILVGCFVMAEPPEVYGMNPVGYDPNAENIAENAPSMSIKQIFRFPAFWLILLAGGLFNFINGGIISNAAALYQSIGADTIQASICISVYNAVLLGFSPLFGAVADKKGPRLGTIILGCSTICGVVAALMISGMSGAVITAALISATGVCGALAPVTLVKVFGGAEAGSLIGYAMAFGSIGQMTAAPLAAKIFVNTGSFRPFIMIVIVFSVIVMAFITIATGKNTSEKIHKAVS